MNKVQRPFPEMGLGASAPKWRMPNIILQHKMIMVNDMVCTSMKVGESLQLANL